MTRDEDGAASTLDRPGVYRVNVGHSKATFDSLVGAIKDADHTELDRLMPHPVYAMQHWVAVLNPSKATFESVVIPLLEEAHERIARARRRVAGSRANP